VTDTSFHRTSFLFDKVFQIPTTLPVFLKFHFYFASSHSHLAAACVLQCIFNLHIIEVSSFQYGAGQT